MPFYPVGIAMAQHGMIASTPDYESPWPPLLNWDWWPLARLLTTGAVLGLAAHFYLGWTPDLRHVARLPREVFEVLSFFTLVSFALAHLYLMLLMFPLYAIVTLNDTFYGLIQWLCGAVLRIRSKRLLAVGGLLGEVLMFGGLALLIRHFVAGV